MIVARETIGGVSCCGHWKNPRAGRIARSRVGGLACPAEKIGCDLRGYRVEYSAWGPAANDSTRMTVARAICSNSEFGRRASSGRFGRAVVEFRGRSRARSAPWAYARFGAVERLTLGLKPRKAPLLRCVSRRGQSRHRRARGGLGRGTTRQGDRVNPGCGRPCDRNGGGRAGVALTIFRAANAATRRCTLCSRAAAESHPPVFRPRVALTPAFCRVAACSRQRR